MRTVIFFMAAIKRQIKKYAEKYPDYVRKFAGDK